MTARIRAKPKGMTKAVMSEMTISSGSDRLPSIDKNMLRVSNPAWGSRLVGCANGDVKLFCGDSPWGYSAQLELTDVPAFLNNAIDFQIRITMTVLRGDVSVGLLTSDGQFGAEFCSFPKKQKLVLPISVRPSHSNTTLMIRNGTQPNSILRIHDILVQTSLSKIAQNTQLSKNLEKKNADFWSMICGSLQADQLGVTDFSIQSLKRFDDWFFGFYPYVFLHIPFPDMAGKDVLEVGLGYGTVSQRLAEWGGRYTGLDIAPDAVNLVNRRLRQAGLSGEARVGSILDAPFEAESFDRVVSIGCLHHTGDLARSIDECWRVLRPGGQLIMMVYNAYSFRRWVQALRPTVRLWARERLGYRGALASAPGERHSYDANNLGEEAPHLDVVSITSLRHLCRRFTNFSATRENIDQERPFAQRTRNDLLKTAWPRIGGTDIYVTAKKRDPWYKC